MNALRALNLTDQQHADRERAYLTAIAENLRNGNPSIECHVDTVAHSIAPVLEFPQWFDSDHGFSVWTNWETEDDAAEYHEMNIVPYSADHFPVLPDGLADGDVEKAADMIRAYVAKRGLVEQ